MHFILHRNLHNTWDAYCASGRYACSATHRSRFIALWKAAYRVLRFRTTDKPLYLSSSHRWHPRVRPWN